MTKIINKDGPTPEPCTIDRLIIRVPDVLCSTYIAVDHSEMKLPSQLRFDPKSTSFLTIIARSTLSKAFEKSINRQRTY